MADEPRKKPARKKKAAAKKRPAGKKPSSKPKTEEFLLPDEAKKPPPQEPSEDVTEVRPPEPDAGPDTEESELDELISAETQEFDAPGTKDGVEPDSEELEREDESAERPALVAQTADSDDRGFIRRHLRFPLWARFLTASFLIVASVGTATAASLINYVGGIADDLTPIPGVSDRLGNVDGGDPQTILILGSDKRPELKGGEFKGLSDTTMLLRVDPDRNAIALFSLPRDLEVEIPGFGTNKLNAAYAFGGPELTLQTIQQLTTVPGDPVLNDGLPIHHLVNVDFEGFARAVNEIDCVYVDVDRRYFHKNANTTEDYEEIDIQPGYQALCGFDALDYARYRHTDNDVVRAARQQDFLREARAKVPPEVLFAERKRLIDIFTEHTSSDIRDPATMLQVLKLFIEARDDPIQEVHFEGTLGPSFVTATPDEIQKAVRQFLGIEDTPGQRGATAAPEAPVSPETAPDATGATPAAGAKAKAKRDGGSEQEAADLTPTTYGKELAKSIRARKVKLPVYYPTVLESGSEFDQKPRVYKVNGTGDGSPPNSERAAYKWVFSRPALGEYYGFMATRWSDPPILDEPSETRKIGDREYELFYAGDRLRIVAWQTDEGSFWVSNTLIQSLSDREMIEIAEGMRELPKPGGG
jgi:LCP family protein required for cell wall assembly